MVGNGCGVLVIVGTGRGVGVGDGLALGVGVLCAIAGSFVAPAARIATELTSAPANKKRFVCSIHDLYPELPAEERHIRRWAVSHGRRLGLPRIENPTIVKNRAVTGSNVDVLARLIVSRAVITRVCM